MNCKPGDLAVIVRSNVGNEGAIVQVIKALGVEPEFGGYIWRKGVCRGQFCWLVKSNRPLKTSAGGARWSKLEIPVPDSVLRHIRDSDGEDEMLRIAGKPQECEKQS